MNVFIKLLKNGKMPEKQTAGSAGYDLFAAQECLIKPREWSLVHLGFEMAFESGYEAQIRSRSGLSLKNGIVVMNSPGTIDSDYRKEVGAVIFNASNDEFLITMHMRIAQMIFCKVEQPVLQEMILLDSTERSGGFGSTGL